MTGIHEGPRGTGRCGSTVAVLRDLLLRALVTVGAGAGYVLLHVLCPRRLLGPGGGFWNTIRQQSVGTVSALLGEYLHTDRPIRQTEFVRTFDVPLSEVERVLWEAGFHRNPLAAVKMRDGRPEDGSWVWREHPRARRQLHVMLFEARGDGSGVEVYAHEEFSNVNPSVAFRHYRGIDQREAVGVRMAREILPKD